MNIDRRNFIRLSVAGIGTGIAAARMFGQATPTVSAKSIAGLKSPKIENLKLGLIGCGGRGWGDLNEFLKCEGTECLALCDIVPNKAANMARKIKNKSGTEPKLFTDGPEAYKKLLEMKEIDAVIIATPWDLHTPMAVNALKAGKHTFIEVPAAVTLEECWQLVDAAEAAQKNCMMLENCCYGEEELLCLNLCRMGLLGELTYGECGYIHDLRGQLNSPNDGEGLWRPKAMMARNGNLYPTHGLGPIAQYMNINRGDRFDYLVSMSTPSSALTEYAREKTKQDNPYHNAEFKCGDMNSTLIKTIKGRTIMVQHDVSTPRPYDRINLIQGSKGTFRSYPARIALESEGGTHAWQDANKLMEKHMHPLWKKLQKQAEGGSHGGMDFIMAWRAVYCLRNGEALDQDVYDAAAWSCITPLSEESVANRSRTMDIPDFTRGNWKNTPPLGIVS